eukprot:CAMPEP_0113454038 /NCGR_PEP_ID=MMETSP0014_2-20120614/7661_1 /TAXON_ID=2857 /ORGANISM="Nitzschia sp." /LENGTH=380 /DNA_ID=CAMNT_0000345439 /DNA_START=63 /DNA_END=1205 /DNA_ORIENTATION=+ /assembly_acc=CAM_ASM_000159
MSMFQSPTGVANFVDPSQVNGKLNSSFSWTDAEPVSPTLKTPSKKKKKSAVADSADTPSKLKSALKSPTKEKKEKKLKAGKKEKKKSSGDDADKPVKEKKMKSPKPSKKKKKVKAEDVESDTIRALKAQMEEVQQRLLDLNSQKENDAVEYKERLKTAKKECKEHLESVYRPMITSHVKDGKEQKQKQMESQKMIEYLRSENAKIRKDIEFYGQEIKKMFHANENLEKANKKADEAYNELEDHVHSMTEVNEKLNENVTIFKGHIKTMKDDYLKRTRHHMCEVRTSNSYETCLHKIVSSVKDRSRDADLIDELATMVDAGSTEAIEDKTKHCPAVELSSLPVPKGLDDMTKQGKWSFMVDETSTDSDSDSDSDDDDDDDM